MPPVTTTQNTADFILDGQQFFTRMKALLTAVRQSAPDAGTYIRMASWSADSECDVGGPGNRTRLIAELRAVALAGHKVELILWQPSQTDRLANAMARAVHTQNTEVHRLLHNTMSGRIRVYLEGYNGWVGTATHQKIFIASIAGQRTVLLGGINLENHYYSNATHNPVDQNFWHDTAVELSGPATTAVEDEWVRRWNKSSMALTANTTAQTNHAAVGGAPVSVTIATTNTESSTRVNDIRAQVVAAIGAANDYVYLENYAVCDPAIITALRARMAAVPALRVIIVVPHDLTGDDYPYRYLMRHTWLKLASTSFRSLNMRVPSMPLPRSILRASRPRCTVREDQNAGNLSRSVSSTFSNKWLENDALVFSGGGQADQVVKLVDIIDMDTDFRIYAPVVKSGGAPTPIYVHSKLILIDDEILIVGSANWTYRSMVYDGEIAAIINNPTIATAARTALFGHYNAPTALTPANWAATAAANETGFGALPNGRHVIVPVPEASFLSTLPGHSGNFTWY